MKTQAAIFSPAGCEAATTSHRARLASSAASVIMSYDDSEHLWFVRETQQILHWSCTGHFRTDSSKKMNWWKKLEIIKKKKPLLLKTLWKTRENCTLHQFSQHIVPLTLFTFDGSDLIAISAPDWLHYLPADLWGCFCSLTQTPPPKWIEAKRPSLRFIITS